MIRPRLLLLLYPPWWRRRYGDEALAILEEAPVGGRVALDLLRGALDAWLHQRPLLGGDGRFAEDARSVLAVAAAEAHKLGHGYLGTEHLLLGLLADPEAVGAKALADLGLTPEAVRERVTQIVGSGCGAPLWRRCVTPRAKRVLALARLEADRSGGGELGSEHLLLGLLREGEGVAAGVLAELGVDEDGVRGQLARLADR